MRIYEVVTEYKKGKEKNSVHDRIRFACNTFDEARILTEAHLSDRTRIRSVELIADTEL